MLTGEQFCDLRPSIPEPSVRIKENFLLCGCPLTLADVRVEMVQPTFTALFAVPVPHMRCYQRPLRRLGDIILEN